MPGGTCGSHWCGSCKVQLPLVWLAGYLAPGHLQVDSPNVITALYHIQLHVKRLIHIVFLRSTELLLEVGKKTLDLNSITTSLGRIKNFFSPIMLVDSVALFYMLRFHRH